MEIITITSKVDLLKFQLEIERLFFECFGGRMLGAVWHWLYIENPNNDPLVTLCFEGKRLVGHYAIISMPLLKGGDIVNSYLSATTMVSESHRKYGLFVKLANENYRIAYEKGVDFIMGFPNALSTPGFKKRLNWIFPPIDYVVTISTERLLDLDCSIIPCAKNGLALNLNDQKTLYWRLSRPDFNYIWDDGLLYKDFEGGIDLMYLNSPADLKKLPPNKRVNIILRYEDVPTQDCPRYPYQFGGVTIKNEFVPANISRQMCLSDVF